MWLTCSSVGRKFIMALTGTCLVLFVTFHCVMNAIAIVWPTAYNVICEFLGANWYALVASLGLALLFVIHIIYASWLTILNRKARGNQRYLASKPAPGVEWSSKNMYVLGIVILAFLVVHLIQFWAKMQLQEIRGEEGLIPPQAGTLFIQEAFALIWTPIVYIIGFVALWFHMNHGFWSMFQSCGWTNTTWIPRLKKIGAWWTTIVIALFVAQAVVFTAKAQEDYYKTDGALRNQYVEMILNNYGMGSSQSIEYADFAKRVNAQYAQLAQMPQQQRQMYEQLDPNFSKMFGMIEHMNQFFNYLEGKDINAPAEMPDIDPAMLMQQQEAAQPAAEEGAVVEEQAAQPTEQAAKQSAQTETQPEEQPTQGNTNSTPNN